MEKKEEYAHFQGKEAMQHIVEVQAEGVIASSEIHGAETPGFHFAGCDAARETAVAFALLASLLSSYELSPEQQFLLLLTFSFGWIFWKLGRAAWLSWSRLERLHRVMDEERREIETNREQERVELKALYAAKGFQGKLLDEVTDVLMADQDRLLRVMLEEELGFRLQQNEHPLVQGLGAAAGAVVTTLIVCTAFIALQEMGLLTACLLVIACASFYSAHLERNNPIAAIVWNLGIAIFAYCVTYFSMQFILG